LTLCGHFPSHIIEGLLRRLISDAGMATLAVIEDLDVFGVVARTLPVLLGRPFPDRLDGVDAAQIK